MTNIIKKDLKLAFSTCPNDTFIFAAIALGLVESKYTFDIEMDDVQYLNKLALANSKDIIKVSYGVLPSIINNYAMLPAGGALGVGCGPLLVAKNKNSIDGKIAIPGFNTTAYRLFSHFYPTLKDNCIEMRFDMIMPAVSNGSVAAGVVIHEGRFTYPDYNIEKVADLGELWEEQYNTPIPLGGIAIRRSLGSISNEINNLIQRSLTFAYNNPEKISKFISEYSDEMSADVMQKHINLYVNEYSMDASKAKKEIGLFLDLAPELIFI